MLNNARECRDTGRMLTEARRHGQDVYDEAAADIRHEYMRGNIRNFSLRTLFEETVTDHSGELMGHYLLREMGRERQGGVLMEAGGDAMTTANFNNIIGQISYGEVLRNFDTPLYVGDQLVTAVPADTALPVMVPGITMIGDQAEKVGEGEEYPIVGFGQQFITLPRIDKEGFILAITEEAVREDRTGEVMRMLNTASESMAIAVEKERLNVVLGIESTYSRNGGPVQATYADTHTEGDFDNLIAGTALVDHTDIEASDNAFQDVTDPDTGEPISLGGMMSAVVPWALRWTAWQIMNATSVKRGDVIAGAYELSFPNPIPAMAVGGVPPVVSSPYVASIVGNSTTWFRGDFKRAFIERIYWPTQVFVEDRNSGVGFSRDIIGRTKVRRKTKTAAREPRYVQKLTA